MSPRYACTANPAPELFDTEKLGMNSDALIKEFKR